MSSKQNKLKEGDIIKKCEVSQEVCCICLQSLKSNPDENKSIQSGIVYRLSCKHEYHNICLCKWIESLEVEALKMQKRYWEIDYTCPLCRKLIHNNDCNTIYALQHDCFDDKSKKEIYTDEYINLN